MTTNKLYLKIFKKSRKLILKENFGIILKSKKEKNEKCFRLMRLKQVNFNILFFLNS